MLNKRQAGVTLVELIIAMVIIGVAVAGVLQVFNLGSVASANPLVTKQLRAVAEGLMDEIQRQPFTRTDNPAAPDICTRNTFNDVLDYDGYKPGYICLVNGEAVAGLENMTVEVTVVNTDTLTNIADANAYLITVKTAKAGNEFTLRGWRTNFANGVPQ